ncbi:hypothetical protein BDZ97DRAFT_1801393 [Flammula alnicola]|nr:hypothetical protein BDZ97DRAFT_1801393 [Flammula alnicola]
MFAARALRLRPFVRQCPPRLIHTTDVTPTDYTVRIMAASNSGRFADCLHLAARMKSDGLVPDASIYNALMSLAARDRSWLFAWAIFDDMLLAGIQPTSATFTHLIQAQRDRPFNNLWNAIERMDQLGFKPNAPIYTSIINCLLAAARAVVILAAECGHSRLAIEIATYFEDISLRRLDDSAWVACLTSAAQNLYVDGVTKCWPIIVDDLSVIPSEGVCLAVLNTAARHGLPDLATDVLRVLKIAGIDWQEYHFAALIEAFCRNDQMKEALVTLHIMRTNGINPTGNTTAFILDSIKSDVDSLDSAWALIDDIHTSDGGLDVGALKVVIQASIFLGDLQRAVGIYKSFHDYGLAPDLATFNLLLEGCIGAQHRQLGDLLLNDMKQARVKPDEETYEKMINLCLTQDTYEDAFYYLEEMKATGHVPPQEVYEALLQKCLSAEDTRSSLVLQEMEECGYRLQDTRHKTAATAIHVNRERRERK